MWRELMSDLVPGTTFASPVVEPALQAAESALAQAFPPPLTSLLRETDGVRGEHELGLIWSLDQIVNDNLAFRSNRDFAKLYMPFDPLLFFADAGNGDQFALLSPPVDRDDIFAWDHENDSRKWVAASLEMYLRWWIGGQIKL